MKAKMQKKLGPKLFCYIQKLVLKGNVVVISERLVQDKGIILNKHYFVKALLLHNDAGDKDQASRAPIKVQFVQQLKVNGCIYVVEEDLDW